MTSFEKLTGIIPPVSTPFNEEHEVDIPSLERLLEFLLSAGVDGLFMLGSTSETAFLTDRQRSTILDVAVRVAGQRVPVLAGVIDSQTDRVLDHARAARRAGVDGLVVTPPYYARVSQAEVVEHFRYLHQAVDLPLLAYDIPVAVQLKMEAETILQMAREKLIVGLKDSSGDEGNFRGIVLSSRNYPGFSVFTGSELLVDALLFTGADGCVPGLGNVDPHGYVRLYRAARAGNWEAARQEQERLYRLFSIIRAGTPGRMGFTASALGGFKTALMLRGVISTNVMGRPMTRYNPAEVARVRALLAEAGLLAEQE
ncbi:MAG TPA: dihydrodipicolinate synthase family protein [Chloroflexia bacterium]|nr:dihydrodipicolinate synthase family protein [Chloroflexia bacterium]